MLEPDTLAPGARRRSASPTTSSTRWAAAAIATSPSATLAPRRTSPTLLPTAGVERIVYLGGLGDPGSEHLRSRHHTAEILGGAGVPLTYFRAAAVIGAGSESFRVVYYLVRRLPAMVTPRWVDTRRSRSPSPTWSPICAAPARSRRRPGREIEIGGPEVTTYGGMMERMARRARPPAAAARSPVPLLTPRLSSLWIGLVTPVDAGVARPLIEGLATETIVRDRSGMELFDVEPTRDRRGDARGARRTRVVLERRVRERSRPLLLERAGLVHLEAQRVDHRAGHEPEADQVEPDERDQDEARARRRARRCSTGRGRRGRRHWRSRWSRSRTARRARRLARARGPSARGNRSGRRSRNVMLSAAPRTSALRSPEISSRPKGRLSAPEVSTPSATGTTTLAARKSVTTISISSAKRFCSTQPRHSTW